MKKLFVLTIALFCVVIGYAYNTENVEDTAAVKLWVDSTSIVNKYKAKMDSLSIEFASDMGIDMDDLSDNPIYFRLFMPLTLYKSAISEAITPSEEPQKSDDDGLLPIDDLSKDSDYELMRHINNTLLRVYMEHPELVKMTEDELMSVKGPVSIIPDPAVGLKNRFDSKAEVHSTEAPEFVVNKPIYWSTFGNFQGKYTQSYYSDNWYKGGEKNHSFLAQVVLEAKYAKKQTTLDNKLEMKLGYYTTEINGERTLKTNEDLLRATSKYGLKAVNSWYYSAQIQGYTQFMPVYDNKDNLKSKFFAPVYGSLSVGMDYKPKFKNKNITLSALLSPISYNCRYVSVDSIANKFGIDKGKNYKYTIGSKIDANWTWKFLKNFKWTGKAQYYSNYESVEANIENTLDYMLSKYISLQFFVHWRYDDSVKPDDKFHYNQLKEFLTLNFNYSW